MSNNLPEKRATSSDILFYQAENGISRIKVHLEDETVWLPQKKGLAELYQVTVLTVNEHIKNIYSEDELIPEATIRKFRILRAFIGN